jgi:hypothetical protein
MGADVQQDKRVRDGAKIIGAIGVCKQQAIGKLRGRGIFLKKGFTNADYKS